MNYRNTDHGKTTLYNKFAFILIILVLGTLTAPNTYKWTSEQNKLTVTNVFAPVAHD